MRTYKADAGDHVKIAAAIQEINNDSNGLIHGLSKSDWEKLSPEGRAEIELLYKNYGLQRRILTRHLVGERAPVMDMPSYFSPERITKLIEGFKVGLLPADACAFAGISFKTFQRWQSIYKQITTSESPEHLYAQDVLELFGRIEEVTATTKAAMLGVIYRAATKDGNFRAAKTYLSIIDPAYDKPRVVNNNTYNIDMSKLSSDQLRRLVAGESPDDVVVDSYAVEYRPMLSLDDSGSDEE